MHLLGHRTTAGTCRTTVRSLTALALTLGVALGVVACGSGTDNTRAQPKADMTALPFDQVVGGTDADAKVVRINFHDGAVSPDGEEVKVSRKQAVILRITSDEPGELHVHSSPDHVIAFPTGRSAVTLRIDLPGLVAIEDHKLGKLLVQLEVG